MFFHRLPLPSKVMSHSTIFPICQSRLTAIRKWNVSFHLSGAFLGDNSPDCSLWRGIERASLAAVSARHLHKPMSLPPHPCTTASPGCTVLQDTPSEEDSQEVPEHSRITVKLRSSFTGSVLSHGLSTHNPESAEWHSKYFIIKISTFDRISDTSIALSTSLFSSPVVAEPPRLSSLAGRGSPYRSPV